MEIEDRVLELEKYKKQSICEHKDVCESVVKLEADIREEFYDRGQKYLPAIDKVNRLSNEFNEHERVSHDKFTEFSKAIGSITEANKSIVKELDLIGAKMRELADSESRSIERDFHVLKDIKELKQEVEKSSDAYFNQFREHDKKEMEKYDKINASIVDSSKKSEERHALLLDLINTERTKNDKRYNLVLKVFWTVTGGLTVLTVIANNIDKIKGYL